MESAALVSQSDSPRKCGWQEACCLIMLTTTLYVTFFEGDFIGKVFMQFINWCTLNPEKAALVFIGAYSVCQVFWLPTTQFHIAIGFVYSSVFQNSYKGFAVGTPLAILAFWIAAMISFGVARLLFKSCIKERIK